MNSEGLPSPRDRELALLRSHGARRQSLAILKTFAAFLALFIGAMLTLFAIQQYRAEITDPLATERALQALDTTWADELAQSQRRYREWFYSHGTKTESALFEEVSVTLLQSVLSIAASGAEGEKLSFLSSFYITLHSGLIRVMFITLALTRVIFVIALGALVIGLRAYKAYNATDLLGQGGNGRIFYSGVRVGLDEVDDSGAPTLLLRGLACPPTSTEKEAMSCELWRVLEEYNAANETNKSLVAILVKNAKTSSYVPLPDEISLLGSWFAGDGVLENATHLVRSALTLHGIYRAGEYRSQAALGNSQEIPAAPPPIPWSSEEYARYVQISLHRVLRAESRQLLGAIDPAEVATALLAYECGKVLAHSYEGGKWVRKSNYPHLSGRAVLHSVPAYPVEYHGESRHRIRRSLVYASRHSAFAPVRMPIDLTEDTWALRQWLEVFTAAPHELSALSDEIELVGLIRGCHNRWLQEFLDGAVAFRPEIAKNSFATPSNLMFVPVPRLVEILQKAASLDELKRLEELSSVVSDRQRLKQAEAASMEGGGQEGPVVERVYPPLAPDEVTSLSTLHNLTPQQISHWAAFRIVLSSHGWLARRVGDYTVPDSSVIFSVFRPDVPHTETNAFGFIGRQGMVPLRGSRLEDRWGKNWANRFITVSSATMAESKEDYEKLLRGIDDRDEEASLSDGVTPATA